MTSYTVICTPSVLMPAARFPLPSHVFLISL